MPAGALNLPTANRQGILRRPDSSGLLSMTGITKLAESKNLQFKLYSVNCTSKKGAIYDVLPFLPLPFLPEVAASNKNI